MLKLVTLYLLITGIAAFVALVAPSLVVLGMFLFILPGLVLALAPTAFLWGCVFALFWFPLRVVLGDWLALFVSLPLAAGLLWLATRPENIEAERRFAEVLEPDVEPPEPIALRGDIMLRDNRRYGAERRLPGGNRIQNDPGELCSPLCTALLFTDGVESVTVERPHLGRRETYRLRPKEECRTPVPLTIATTGGNALTLYWAARLDEGYCIDKVEPAADQADIVIGIEFETAFGPAQFGPDWSLAPRGVSIERITIEQSGRLLFRRSLMRTRPLSPLLTITPSGGVENFRFGWARTELSNKPRHSELKLDSELQEATTIRLEVDPRTSREGARKTIAAALDDPERPAADPAFMTVPSYLQSFIKLGRSGAQPAEAEDFELLRRLVADPRVRDFNGVYHLADQMGEAMLDLRGPIVRRVVAAQPDELPGLKPLAELLSSMPQGTFAQMTPIERSLVEDVDRRKRAPALVSRLHDQGASAVPLLGRILEEHLSAIEGKRSSREKSYDSSDILIVDRARMALCQLGEKGRAALPIIARLEAQGLVNRRLGEHRAWHLMLARIGRPVTAIPKPDNLSGTTAQFHQRLETQLRNFAPDRDCGSEWS